MIKKVIVDSKGNVQYWSSGDVHTLFGKILEADVVKGGVVKSHLNKEFVVFDASFADRVEKISRGPAVISKKDVGNILVTTGINKDSRVVDVGTGSGMLALHLAHISSLVTSYEKSKEFYDIAMKNAEKLGVKVVVKNKDVFGGIEERDVDVVTVDLKEPWLLLAQVASVLRSGGFCVAYLPHVHQVQQLCGEAEKQGFLVQKVSEMIERDWVIDGLRSRPESTGILHTGFLVFLRKVGG